MLNDRRPAFWLILTAVIACVAAAVCFPRNSAPEESSLNKPDHSSDSTILRAALLEIHEGYYLVEPEEGSRERTSASQVEVQIGNDCPSPEPEVGDLLEIVYSGEILETCPARIPQVYSIRVMEDRNAALLKTFERCIGAKETARVSGYVFAEDGAYGLDGVVQYEDASGSPWKLAFIHDGSASPVSQDWEPGYVLVGKLAYLGNGVVRAYVENTEDGSLYACTMAYSYDEETHCTNFESAVNRVQLSYRLRRDRLNACPTGNDGLPRTLVEWENRRIGMPIRQSLRIIRDC